MNNGKDIADELERAYASELEALEEAERQLRIAVESVIAQLPPGRLVRADIAGSRVKSLESVRRRAKGLGIQPSNALTELDDLVGLRVVCNNLEDVRRFADLLVREFDPQGPPPTVQDYVTTPKASGYRGIHVSVSVRVGGGFVFGRPVRCEVQIRTLLQDAWARLVHHDVYKEGDGLPEDLLKRPRDLADIIATADDMAGRIRDRIMEVRPPPDGRPDLSRVSDEGFAYLYAQTFSKGIPDYVLRAVQSEASTLGLNSLETLEAVLSDGDGLERLRRAYSELSGWPLTDEILFEFMPRAAVRGIEGAEDGLRERARQERREVEEYWRAETLSELPDTYEEFVEALEAGELNVTALADVFEAHSDCGVCAKDLIIPDAFQEAVFERYEHEDWEDFRVGAYIGSEYEVPDPDHSSLCSYHGYVMSKDD